MPKKCPDCRIKRCSYGYPGGVPVICCDCVKDEKMINLYVPKCTYLGCDLSASYGRKNGSLIRCQSHADISIHVPLTGRLCINCNTKATYGVENTKTPIHCSTCALEGEVRLIKARLCECGQTANYRLKYITGQPAILKRPTHCGKCMNKDTMESTLHDKCETINCTLKKHFIKGIANDFCKYHTTSNIIHCVQPNCTKLIISNSDRCIRHRSDKYILKFVPNRLDLKTALKYYLGQI
jgi:hypothetical protein